MAAGDAGEREAVPDGARLWRRITRDQVVRDENSGAQRISSAAFTDPEMSVSLADTMEADGRTWRDALSGYAGYGLVEFSAADVRKLGLDVHRDPLPEEPAHALVTGRKGKPVKKGLVRAARVIVWPDPHPGTSGDERP